MRGGPLSSVIGVFLGVLHTLFEDYLYPLCTINFHSFVACLHCLRIMGSIFLPQLHVTCPAQLLEILRGREGVPEPQKLCLCALCLHLLLSVLPLVTLHVCEKLAFKISPHVTLQKS